MTMETCDRNRVFSAARVSEGRGAARHPEHQRGGAVSTTIKHSLFYDVFVTLTSITQCTVAPITIFIVRFEGSGMHQALPRVSVGLVSVAGRRWHSC